jgi:glycosyltransferase involved in cell wall biosynthesis
MLSAQGDWILSTDADLSAPIEEVLKLIEAARREQAVVAIGSRAIDRSLIQVHQPLLREYSGRAFNLVMRVVTGLPFQDTQCGFKLFRRDAAREIFKAADRGRVQFRRGGSGDRPRAGTEGGRGSGAMEQRGRHQGQHGAGMKSFADLLRIRTNAVRGKYK